MNGLKNKRIQTKSAWCGTLPILAALLLTSACTASQHEPAANTAPTLAKKAAIKPKKWVVNNCNVEATVNNTYLKTDATISHNTIRFSVLLPAPSQEFLKATLLGIGGFNLNVTGRRDRWALELPNTPYATAQMITGKAYLLLTYKPEATTHMPAPLEEVVVFPLIDLPEALKDQEALCN